LNLKGCNERRCRERRRQDVVKKPFALQCRMTIGYSTVRFCELRTGHEGLHLHGTTEWSGTFEHPAAKAVRG
jgi:hypothetical protein